MKVVCDLCGQAQKLGTTVQSLRFSVKNTYITISGSVCRACGAKVGKALQYLSGSLEDKRGLGLREKCDWNTAKRSSNRRTNVGHFKGKQMIREIFAIVGFLLLIPALIVAVLASLIALLLMLVVIIGLCPGMLFLYVGYKNE